MNRNQTGWLPRATKLSPRLILSLCAGVVLWASQALAVPPPTGVAPVLVPTGGFGIDGDLFANTPRANTGDWLTATNFPGTGGGVLDASGAPLNPATTFHFIDPYNSSSDNTFVGGLKWTDDPNTWQWSTGKASSKCDINNVLLHMARDANGHAWVIVAADRFSTSGDSYIDFEFLQNTLTSNTNGAFTSAGPNGGRTVNDLLLSLAFTGGGSVADFFAWRWLTNTSGGFAYFDATASLPVGRVFVAANSNTVAVPFGAFGSTNYAANAFAEAAIDLTALLGNFDPCLSVGFKTIMVKTKTSQSSTATISDFINPIQYTLKLGPSAYAGPAQTQCSGGASTAFALQGQATPGMQPIASTTWSVLSGTATIDNPNSLVTTAHVSSSSATLRLTVIQSNGCTETSDVVLTVSPLPACSIAGPSSVCPQSRMQFLAPAGMSSYLWSLSGNASISGPTNAQAVTVVAGPCGTNFTLGLSVASNLCPSTCSVDVQVTNSQAPAITSPADLVLECPANTSTNVTGVASVQDSCPNVVVTYIDAVSNTCGGAKIIARTWTATDLCGSTASAVQTITVRDTTPPTIIAPPNRILNCPADTSVANTGAATAQDGCSAVVINYSDVVSNGCGGSKVIARLWTATDACGNSASAVQTITVRDSNPPTITAPPSVVLECPADTSTNATGVAAAQASCSSVTITYSDVVSNSCGGAKVIARTWTATDACGNHASALQTITVRDTTPPTITAPANLTLECPAETSTNATGVATAQDGCSSVTIAYSDVVSNGCAGTKVIARTWTATDACGNSASALQTITVRDTTPPTITPPQDLVLQCPADTRTNATGVATAQDGCSAVTIRYSDVVSNSCGGAKVIARTWTATDACGNSASAVQNIIVQDTTPPTITAPPSLVLECPGVTTTNATGVATAQDGCSAVTIAYTDVMTNGCGGTYGILRTWTATDACGNRASALQTIIVRDTTAPRLTVPPSLVLECPANTSTNSTGVATASDTCSSVTITYADVTTNGCGGTYGILRTWTATDACGNSASALQTITVRDTAPPRLTVPPSLVLECPANTSTNHTGVATATDTCSSVTITYADVTTNGCGGTYGILRTWTATDACGNSVSGLQTITIRDTTPPIITPPPSLVLQCPANTSTNATGVATASDTCSMVTITYSDLTTNGCGSTYGIVRTWTATDACGNSASVVQTIVVRDSTPPTLVIPANVVLECPVDTSTNHTGIATAQSTCATVTLTYSDIVSNICGGAKIISRIWSATDTCGNVTNRVQTITVRDTTPPSFVVPANVVLQCPADTSTNSTGIAIAQDACGPSTVRYSDTISNICGGAKVISRLWTATDQCGNSTNRLQTITLLDTNPPTLTIPIDVTLECGANTAPSATGTATAQDTCSSVAVTYSDVVSNICGGSKVISRTWLATDACGNRASGVQTITVLDRTPPTMALAFPLPCTSSQGGWGGGGGPAQLLQSSYMAVFTNGLTLGIYDPTNGNAAPNGLFWQASAAGLAALQVAVSQGSGSGAPITQDAVNPTGTFGAGGLGRQTLGLTLNVGFNSAGLLGGTNVLRSLIYTNTGGDSLSGMSVNQILAVANQALAGLPLPAGYDFSGLSGVIDSLNLSFENCTESSWAAAHLVAPNVLVVQCASQVPPPDPSTIAASDTCSGPVTVTNLPDVVIDYFCPSHYTIERVWVASDACGNTNSLAYFIQVDGTNPPALKLPPNVVLECPAQTGTNATGTATAQGACGPAAVSYSDVISNTCGGAKIIARTWTATDGCNSTSQVQTITVRDTTPPTITPPASLVLECPADTGTNATGVATAQDGCSSVTIAYSDMVSNICGGAGVIARTWTATDACGNRASALQTITVRDTTPPSLQCAANKQVTAGQPWSFDQPIASDTCSAVTLQVLGTATNLSGPNLLITRTWAASDACGNSSTCQQTVTVAPPPVAPTVASQPRSQIAGYGNNLTLAVSAGGSGPLSYQWQLNGVNIAGATGSSLNLANLQFTNAGLYRVVISNAAGVMISQAAIIDVAPLLTGRLVGRNLTLTWPGSFILQSAPSMAGPYTDMSGATSPCAAGPASAPQKFFRLRGAPVALTVTNVAGGNTCLTLGGLPGFNIVVQASTNLTDWVNLVTNTAPCSFVDSNACQYPVRYYRTVLLPLNASAFLGASPQITSQPRGQTAAYGANLNLNVTAGSTASLAYQWSLNGAPIFGATASALQLSNLGFTDAGIYSVTLQNPAGSLCSQAAVVNVVPALTTHFGAEGLTLTWPGPFFLQASSRPDGPFTDVAGATSPFFTHVIGLPQKFFRLRSESYGLSLTHLSTTTSIDLTGPPGYNFIIQASTNLFGWVNLQTNLAPATCVDSNAGQFLMRYYRAVPAQ